jgi:hypothetical protein
MASARPCWVSTINWSGAAEGSNITTRLFASAPVTPKFHKPPQRVKEACRAHGLPGEEVRGLTRAQGAEAGYLYNCRSSRARLAGDQTAEVLIGASWLNDGSR